MITLLKSGFWKIMQLFYKDKTARLHLREIARLTKLHEPSVTRFLNSLEKDQILISIHCGSRALGHQIGTDYLEVLESERQMFNAELAATETFQKHLNSYIKLFKALGGGWISETDRQATLQE